ncbi:HAD-IIB family hydrolase [Vibrio gangliei]|uniref:HAD-IIB family hydrolase n=1 Tax=Vibrio gangliei TaxID=2077090 RepID=UPI00130020ED|nr:HAD-IIB family hydrolase [Vibrio gangliei]
MLKPWSKPLIFTDFDGTLLDHDDYNFDAVTPLLQQLTQRNIPVIPNTSKTFAELKDLMAKLSLLSPFIVENGAAVYLPKSIFLQQPEHTESVQEYWCRTFALPRSHWQSALMKAKQEFADLFVPMSEMTDAYLADMTGLTLNEAKLANQREFGEPIQWLGSESKQADFIDYMVKQGATVVKGGRFIHIGSDANKGHAMQWVVNMSQQTFLSNHDECKNWYSIALGDSDNDISMLEKADVAVRIRSKHHPFPALDRDNDIVDSQQYGPSGWVECIEHILEGHLAQ